MAHLGYRNSTKLGKILFPPLFLYQNEIYNYPMLSNTPLVVIKTFTFCQQGVVCCVFFYHTLQKNKVTCLQETSLVIEPLECTANHLTIIAFNEIKLFHLEIN